MSNELSKTKKAEIVFNLVEEIKEAKRNTVKSFLVIGKNLDIIQKEKIWQYYGEHLERFDDFLKEIRIGRATAYNCMAIWREFGQLLISKNLDVDYFRLVRLLPVVKENDDKEEWLNKADTLTIQGFNDEIKEAKGFSTTDTCNHPEEEREYFWRCKRCGKWAKIKKENVESKS